MSECTDPFNAVSPGTWCFASFFMECGLSRLSAVPHKKVEVLEEVEKEGSDGLKDGNEASNVTEERCAPRKFRFSR